MGMWVRVNAGVGTITATEGAMWVHSEKMRVPMLKTVGATLEISGFE